MENPLYEKYKNLKNMSIEITKATPNKKEKVALTSQV